MPERERYDGYRAYEYLDAGSDYRAFELADRQCGDPYEVPLSKTEEERARALMEEAVVVSPHDHVVYFPRDLEADYEDYMSSGRLCLAYDALAASPLDAVLDSIGLANPTSKGGLKWTDVVHELGMRASDIAHQEFVVRAETADDVRTAHENGQLAWIPGVETCSMIENELDRLDVLHGLGVRTLGVTYSDSNALGSGLGEKRDAGLTAFGREAVERMNDLGILIGLSHASDRTTLDVCEASVDPVVLSHNGARALHDIPRLDPDECLQAVAETGGLVGIGAAPHTTITPDRPRHTIETVMEHFEYVADLVGLEHVTLGPDAFYGDHRGLYRLYGSSVPEAAVDVEYVEGMENPTEAWTNFVRWLVEHGYDDGEIEMVAGGNALRVFDAVWS